MKKFFLSILVLISCLLFSQKNIEKEVSIKKMYQINFAGFPRTAELIELTNGEYKGHFKIIVDRENENTTQEIQREVAINKTNVKEVMLILETMGIETITDCQKNNDCKEFPDADFTSFKIKTEKTEREYSFTNLSNEDIKNEKPENRRQAQQILNFIEKRLNFKIEFQKIKDKLPSGRYSYFSGNSIYSFEIK